VSYIKGQVQWQKWKDGYDLTRKETMIAKCYECNGLEGSKCDCLCHSCPMYPYSTL